MRSIGKGAGSVAPMQNMCESLIERYFSLTVTKNIEDHGNVASRICYLATNTTPRLPLIKREREREREREAGEEWMRVGEKDSLNDRSLTLNRKISNWRLEECHDNWRRKQVQG
jgi:hypothetical protein